MSEKISSFRDLRVYQKAFKLQQDIFEISKGFPKEELYSLTDQIRRSSRSVGSNVAEAWLPAHRASSSESKKGDILHIL